ncbi:MAG: helix-turn-helix domain-containing protein [Candidatus Nanoarchaeia archaeon]
MKSEDLRKLGLSQAEATLYLTLLRIGASDVQKLIEETGFYKGNTYDALERLCEKGIISKIIEGNKRIYQLQKPEALVEYVKKKKEGLDQEELLAKELVKKVELVKKHTKIAETAMVFRGISGVKQIYSEIIDEKLDYLVFGSPKESEVIIEDWYWQNLHAKQKEFGIKAKMIFHKSLKHWKNLTPKNIIEIRFLDEELEPLTETTIYGNKVAFTVWTEKPVITIINNEHVANSYKQIFNRLWKSSKE